MRELESLQTNHQGKRHPSDFKILIEIYEGYYLREIGERFPRPFGFILVPYRVRPHKSLGMP